jgi:hypothetical protein
MILGGAEQKPAQTGDLGVAVGAEEGTVFGEEGTVFGISG